MADKLSTSDHGTTDEEQHVRNVGEINTDYYIHGLRIPKYRTAMAQVVMVGLIAFCTV